MSDNLSNHYSGSRALIVGIDEYTDRNFMPLGNAEADAHSVADVLGSSPYDFHVEVLLGPAATKAAVIAALARLRKTEPDDRIVFYFSGHGYTLPTNRGAEIGYLACADTEPDDPYSGLELDEVTKIRDFAPAKHIAFILDACFSGKVVGLTRSAVSPASVDAYLTRHAYQVITAGGVEVVSDASSMTGILVETLRSGIPGHSGPMTLSHLGQHVRDTITARSRNHQIPVFNYLEGSSNGDMVLMTPSPLDGLPDLLRAGLGSDDATTRYFAIGEAERMLSDPAVRAMLESMLYDDPDPKVRRRAGEALKAAPAVSPVQRADLAGVAGSGPRTAVEYHERGLARDKQGDLEGAIADYDEAIRLDPNMAVAYKDRGNVYSDQHKLAEALAEYNQAIRLDPGYAAAYLGRGNVYWDQGKLDEALAEYNRAIQLDPRFVIAYNNRGNIYRDQGKLDEALADYAQAIQLEPRARAYSDRGSVYYDQGRLDEALVEHNQAIQLNPRYPAAYIGQGTVYFRQGKYDEALAAYKQAVQLDPKDASPYVGLGNVYQMQGRLDEALAAYKQAIQLDPKYAMAYNNRGMIYYHQDKLDEALAEFNQAIQVDPKLALAFGNRGLVYEYRGAKAAAIAAFTQCLKLATVETDMTTLARERIIALGGKLP